MISEEDVVELAPVLLKFCGRIWDRHRKGAQSKMLSTDSKIGSIVENAHVY